MTRHFRLSLAAISIAALGACSGANIFRGLGGGPAATEEQVVSMLNFDSYVTANYIRRQRLLASCENLRTFYNQVERSIHAGKRKGPWASTLPHHVVVSLACTASCNAISHGVPPG